MRKGVILEVYFLLELAYRVGGTGEIVPPNSALEFKLDLVEVLLDNNKD
jgi:FKBP-type peptidyl-prolyl cis-trans isomerase